MFTHTQLEHLLGRDLAGLVSAMPAQLIAVTSVAGATYVGYQSSAFQLRFADGRILKGRCVHSAAQAERIELLSRHLEYRSLPRIVLRCNAALLMEWIDGQSLGSRARDPQLLRKCGALQGYAHSRLLAIDDGPSPQATALSLRRHVKETLARLVELAVLDNRLAENTATVAAAYAPDDCEAGFAYGDFCADNLVLHADETVYMVDTETLSIEPYDYDLARTWYRWPMRDEERGVFYRGYREYRRTDDFMRHFPFWAIAALVDGAAHRARNGGVAGAALPVQRLTALLRDLDAGREPAVGDMSGAGAWR